MPPRYAIRLEDVTKSAVQISREVLYLDRRKQKDKPSEFAKWLERHKPNCNRKYTGSSQAMDLEAAERIWGCSLEKHRLVYSRFVGNGDSKGFQHVTTLDPYLLMKVRHVFDTCCQTSEEEPKEIEA